jgi:hypothetical protein
MPLLVHNISANEHLFTAARPQAAVLDWDNEEIPEEIQSLDGGIHIILYAVFIVITSLYTQQIPRMADVTYNTTSFPSLIRTLSNLIQFGAKRTVEPPVVLLGYKERDPAERTLWEMAVKIGVNFERVGERVGSGGKEVEIWAGRVELC